MIDIKQQELDKAFLDGASAADDAILDAIKDFVPAHVFEAASRAVADMLYARIGEKRLDILDVEHGRGNLS